MNPLARSVSSVSLIVRFALSVPDLPLTIDSPASTTPLLLLHQHIRPHLPPALRQCPIRLIASGALLSPSVPLSTSLRLPTAPNGKGKAKASGPQPAPAPTTPIYIHCSVSITQTLSPSALAAEADSARLIFASSQISSQNGIEELENDNNNDNKGVRPIHSPAATSPPRTEELRGFDRLLTAGLSPSEIASLRSQFLAIQAHTHTPDTMPTSAQMRILEERWLDSSGAEPSSAGRALVTGADGLTTGDLDGDDDGGALEDMLWGNVAGFFWPVGAAVWLMREEGVWSKRRQIAVVTGVLVNLAFSVMRFGG